MNAQTSEAIETLIEEASRTIVEFRMDSMRGKHARNWHALRVYPDGRIVTVEEPSQCIPESEYFGRSPHPMTFVKENGNCYFPDPESGFARDEAADGKYIAPAIDSDRYKVAADLADDEISALTSDGWVRFDLDLSDYYGDLPEADDETLESVREWAADNYRPEP